MLRVRRPALLVALVVPIVVASAYAGALPAASHSELVSAVPAQDAVVEAPTEVRLTFNEELIQAGSDVSVTDSAGDTTVLVPTYPEPATLTASLPALAAGTASVQWRVVSADGHPIEGVLSFTVVQPEPSPSASVTPTSEQEDPAPSPSPSASAVPISQPQDAAGGIPPWMWVALIAAVVAATAVAVVTSRRR